MIGPIWVLIKEDFAASRLPLVLLHAILPPFIIVIIFFFVVVVVVVQMANTLSVRRL